MKNHKAINPQRHQTLNPKKKSNNKKQNQVKIKTQIKKQQKLAKQKFSPETK